MTNEFTYFEDGQTDRVMGVIWQLAQETYVARQRVLALESLLVDRGVLQRGELDAYRPDSSAQEHLTDDGQAMMARLTRTISETDDSHVPMREQFEQELATES